MKTFTKSLAAALCASSVLFSGPALADHHAEQEAVAAAAAEVEAAADAAANVEAAGDAVEAAVGGETQTGTPAMWKVADEDTTIYLFGTVHALPKEVNWLNSSITDALGSSDSIVTEILMDDSVEAKMVQLVGAKGILPADTTLRLLLDEKQKATYEAALGKLGMPAAAFDRFEPWYAGMVLTMLPLMQQGYSPDAGVEKILIDQAGEKDRAALETIEFQIGLFDGLPQESQIAFLVETADNVDEIKNQLDAMVAEWLEGDADDLAKLMNEGMTDKTLAEQLLYARNRNWANWIDERLDTPGTVFIAVGAGHLAGEESVQDALEDLGIVTQRVQ